MEQSVEQAEIGGNLKETLEASVRQYLGTVGNETQTSNLYELVLDEIEEPLIKTVLESLRYNQVKTAKLLGISRGTLRKKMKKYGLL
jgi:Fis family transcriptional regulator